MDKFPAVDPGIERTITLSEKEATDVLFWSFYYSQASNPVQRNVFKLIATLNPKLRIPNITGRAIAEKEKGRYERIVGQGSSHVQRGKDAIRDQIHGEWDNMLFEFNALDKADKGAVALALLGGLIQVDHNSLHRNSRQAEGRVVKGRHADSPRPETGPFRAQISHFVEYVIENKKGPGPEYFSQVMGALRSAVQDESVVASLEEDEIDHVQALLKVQPAPLDDFPALKARIEAL